MTEDLSDRRGPAPHPHDFSAQLTRQLYADLDGVLFDGEAAADDAFTLVTEAAQAARPRGAVPLLLARAALAAHRTMIFGTPAADDAPAWLDAGEAVASLMPGVRAQLPALQAHARRLTQYLAIAEQSSVEIHLPLARAIERFYLALDDDDAVTGGRALFELRSIVVHLDACAVTLDQADAAPEPLRVIRPDRFHDYFMHYSELARNPAGRDSSSVAATLSEDGHLRATINAERHPLEAAERAVRDMISGDDITREHALARIRALLDFLDQLRRQPQAAIGDARNDSTVHLSLVVAAATTPLHASSRFGSAALSQVARYNQTLLRSAER